MPRGKRAAVAIWIAALLFGGDAATQTPPPETTALQRIGGDGPVYALAWSPDGRTLAAAGFQHVTLWRSGVPSPVATFAGHSGFVRAVAWSPDGKSVASTGQDGTVRVWSHQTLQESTVLNAAPSRAIAWSPDGTRLVVGGDTGHLQVWHVANQRQLHSAWVGATISSVSWSPDGRRLAVGAINGKASIWDATSGELSMILRATGLARNDVNGVAWSTHGRLLASAQGARGEGDVRLWDPETGKVVQRLTGGGSGWLRAVSWSLDGQWIASGGEAGSVRIWNAQTGAVAATRSIGAQPMWSLAWTPDGQSLAAGTGTFEARGPTGSLTLWTDPVTVLPSSSAGAHAREVETALVEKGRRVPAPGPRPAAVTTQFRDSGAYGTVIGPDPPFGNVETSFVEADIRRLGIKAGTIVLIQCADKTLRVVFGTSWADVAAGEWAAFLSLERTLVVARNGASAAAAWGCATGQRVYISREP